MENIINTIEFLQQQEGYQIFANFIYEFGFFLFFLLISFFVGRYTPFYVKLIISKFSQKPLNEFYQGIIDPLQNIFRLAGTLILWSLSLNFIRNYEGLYNLLEFIIDLSLIIIIAWLASRLFRQIIIIYGINLIQKLGKEVDELLL